MICMKKVFFHSFYPESWNIKISYCHVFNYFCLNHIHSDFLFFFAWKIEKSRNKEEKKSFAQGMLFLFSEIVTYFFFFINFQRQPCIFIWEFVRPLVRWYVGPSVCRSISSLVHLYPVFLSTQNVFDFGKWLGVRDGYWLGEGEGRVSGREGDDNGSWTHLIFCYQNCPTVFCYLDPSKLQK